MPNYTYQISENASITHVGDAILIRGHFKHNGLSKSFYVNLFFFIGAVAFILYYNLFYFPALLFSLFVISLSLFSLKSDLEYLLKYKWLKEELKINKENIEYFRNGKHIMGRKFESCHIAFNIENRKMERPEYDENKMKYLKIIRES